MMSPRLRMGITGDCLLLETINLQPPLLATWQSQRKWQFLLALLLGWTLSLSLSLKGRRRRRKN
ncbi:mCG129227 [Mus musculus]|nr:mCG129227 [Mus musculus]